VAGGGAAAGFTVEGFGPAAGFAAARGCALAGLAGLGAGLADAPPTAKGDGLPTDSLAYLASTLGGGTDAAGGGGGEEAVGRFGWVRGAAEFPASFANFGSNGGGGVGFQAVSEAVGPGFAV